MIPNPGSEEAVNKGCTCAILDNGRGRGYWGQRGIFSITQGCPLHDSSEFAKSYSNGKKEDDSD